jgi:rhamnopyranosyl-N-acetylglucosaminyl-diphospho-decaprenol beta-1,3/1,4-galactofuranosyltransferase
MTSSIYTVVVTYNRLAWLKECIDSLRRQTHPIDRIYVVNNGSTDGTREWLESQEDLHVVHQENVGGAGGFHTGMKTAYENRASWIWVMDDDVFFAEDCLEKLLSYQDRSLCLHPRKQYSDGKDFLWEGHFDVDTATMSWLGNYSFRGGKDICYVNVCCFEGMLIHRSIVERIGFPDPRFFVFNDDTVYGLLAHAHTNVAFVRDALATTKKKSTDDTRSDFTLYYAIRNQHLVEEYVDRYFPGGNRTRRRILFHLYVAKMLFIFSFIKRKTIAAKFRTARTVCRAYYHYLLKKTGKGF